MWFLIANKMGQYMRLHMVYIYQAVGFWPAQMIWQTIPHLKVSLKVRARV
jgi:hypothetical protein